MRLGFLFNLLMKLTGAYELHAPLSIKGGHLTWKTLMTIINWIGDLAMIQGQKHIGTFFT